MDTDPYIISSAYTGSKDFSQERVHTANATGFGAALDDYDERGIDLISLATALQDGMKCTRLNRPVCFLHQ